MEAYIL